METTLTALAESLRGVHKSLLSDLNQLEEAANPRSASGRSGLLACLTATQAHIVEHFRYEEQNGYLDTIRKREPRLERNIQELEAEHRELQQMLESLIDEVCAAPTLNEALCDRVRAWVAAVRRHESKENELVEDAFNLDINAED